MTRLPPGLEEFGERLKQAADRDIAQRGPRPRGGRRMLRSAGLPVLAAVVAAAASAGAVRLADREGDPIEPERGSSASLQAAQDPAVVEASAAANPGGGPPWVVRAYTSKRGRECMQVGRLRRGVFGQVQNGRFRALPASAPGTCASPTATGPLVAVARHPLVNLTVVYGLAVDPAAVTVSYGKQRRRIEPAGFGAFVAVLEGSNPRAEIVVRSKVGGRVDERRL